MKLFSCQVGTFAQFSFIFAAALIHSLCLHLFPPSWSQVRPSPLMFVALVPQADRQRCLRAHPRGHGSKERPRRFQQVAVRRQLPDRRQPDPQSARQDQVRGGRARMTLFFTTAVRTGGLDKRGPRRVHQEC